MLTQKTNALRAALIGAALVITPLAAQADAQMQLGTLECQGEGGWGLIITSKKEFDCVFKNNDGSDPVKYTAVVHKYGLDIGKTGDTKLGWLVFGPENKTDGEYVDGFLAGNYGGVTAEATVGVGLGANVLVGGGDNVIALQPVSAQVQTGANVAAGVETFELKYVAPAN
jgi:hypothetical protein